MGSKPRLSPALLEQFRRTGIRLDRHGRFWHEGAEITHVGFRRALLKWLDVLQDGRAVFRLDANRYAYVDVDDAHLLATSIRWNDNRAVVTLNDGTEEELDYATVCIGASDAAYCSVRGGRLRARITTAAFATLAERINETDDGFELRAGGQSFPLGTC